MLFDIVRIVARANPEIDVRAAHMELAEPSIAQAAEEAIQDGAEQVVVHPYMLAPGRHATRDIPRLVEEVSERFPEVSFRVTPPLGIHNCLANIILERSMLQPQGHISSCKVIQG